MPWRAPGSGVLGPRPGTPPQQAMYAAPSPTAPGAYGYGPPPSYVSSYGYSPPPVCATPPPGAQQQQPLDMASLQAALHSATAGSSSSGSASEWYMDSGAASHMTNSPGTLHSLLPSTSSSHIVVGSGEHLPITHTGTGSLISGTSPIQLRNILVSPSLIKNLLSVRQICHDNLVSVEFDLFGFSVKDLRTRAVILHCDSTGDLYSVTAPPKHTASPFVGVVTAARLHQRLGHLGSAQL